MGTFSSGGRAGVIKHFLKPATPDFMHITGECYIFMTLLTFSYLSSSAVLLRMYSGNPIISMTALAFALADSRVSLSIQLKLGKFRVNASLISLIIFTACTKDRMSRLEKNKDYKLEFQVKVGLH